MWKPRPTPRLGWRMTGHRAPPGAQELSQRRSENVLFVDDESKELPWQFGDHGGLSQMRRLQQSDSKGLRVYGFERQRSTRMLHHIRRLASLRKLPKVTGLEFGGQSGRRSTQTRSKAAARPDRHCRAESALNPREPSMEPCYRASEPAHA